MNELITLNDLHAQARRVFEGLDISEATRKDYEYRIKHFLDFADDHKGPDSFLLYKRSLAERGDLSVSTKNKMLASARIFLKELHRRGTVPVDITSGVKGFSQSRKHKREGINEKEMTRLSDHLRGLDPTPKSSRLKAVLALLVYQGLRQIEAVRLDVGDIDLIAKRAMIRGKGRDDKEPIDLHPATVKVLGEYMRTCRIADGPLFRSESNHGKGGRLTTRGLRDLVKTVFKGLDIDRTVHGTRHYFTTRLIKAYGGDLLTVAQYTRHRSLEMLQVYNDAVKREADLPRYYSTFDNVGF